MTSRQESKSARADRQAQEIEANQRALLESIANSKRLVDESEQILRRHRRERRDAGDEG